MIPLMKQAGGWAAHRRAGLKGHLPVTPAMAGSVPGCRREKLALCLERAEEERLEVKLERVLKYSQCMMAAAVDLNC